MIHAGHLPPRRPSPSRSRSTAGVLRTHPSPHTGQHPTAGPSRSHPQRMNNSLRARTEQYSTTVPLLLSDAEGFGPTRLFMQKKQAPRTTAAPAKPNLPHKEHRQSPQLTSPGYEPASANSACQKPSNGSTGPHRNCAPLRVWATVPTRRRSSRSPQRSPDSSHRRSRGAW